MLPTSRIADVPQHQTVVHVINGQHYSGAERVQDLLARRLPESGYDVSFACVKPGKFPALRHYRDAPLHELPMRSRIDMRPALTLARIIRQSQAVLLHAHTPRSLIVARLAAMLTDVPLVYHVHSPTSRDSTRPLQNWINNTTERFSLAGVNRVITVSDSLARHMLGEGVQPERIVTIPNGVPSAGPLRERAVPTDVWTIGTVALFRPRKGLEVLLHAFARLRRAGAPVRLRAVGGFEAITYEREIHALAHQLDLGDAIDWVGFAQDVHDELAKMDLFVLPSLFGEGLPMVVLEAMTAGVPIVATRVEGIPEAVRDGVDAALAAPNDARDLQRAMQRVIESPEHWQSLRHSAYQRHAQHFSDRRMAQQVGAVYDALLTQKTDANKALESAN